MVGAAKSEVMLFRIPSQRVSYFIQIHKSACCGLRVRVRTAAGLFHALAIRKPELMIMTAIVI